MTAGRESFIKELFALLNILSVGSAQATGGVIDTPDPYSIGPQLSPLVDETLGRIGELVDWYLQGEEVTDLHSARVALGFPT